MQTITITPAEKLLQRLLHSEKIESNYSVTVQKNDGYTCISLYLVNLSNTELIFNERIMHNTIF